MTTWSMFDTNLLCPKCHAGGFGKYSITEEDKKKHTGYTQYICQECGYKWISAEMGHMHGVRIIKSEPPECSVKPKQLTGDST